MKSYSAPAVTIKTMNIAEALDSLNQWLSDNKLTDAGITTYLILP